MAPVDVRRRRMTAVVVVGLTAVGVSHYKAVTWVPGDVRDAAVAAVKDENAPLNDGDELWSTCEETRKRTYVCTVTWKQVDRTYADGPADYCVDFRVVVRNRTAERAERLEAEGDGC